MQRFVLGSGCFLIALLTLFPPVKVRGTSTTRRDFLFSRSVTTGFPEQHEIEAGRLLAECILVTALIGFVLCVIGTKETEVPIATAGRSSSLPAPPSTSSPSS